MIFLVNICSVSKTRDTNSSYNFYLVIPNRDRAMQLTPFSFSSSSKANHKIYSQVNKQSILRPREEIRPLRTMIRPKQGKGRHSPHH